MSSKSTAKSCALCQQLLEANRQLLSFNERLLARNTQLELDLVQAQARANLSAPPVVTAEKADKPELAFMEASQMNDQPEFSEDDDNKLLEEQIRAGRDADQVLEEAFKELAVAVEEGHKELVEKGAVHEPASAAV